MEPSVLFPMLLMIFTFAVTFFYMLLQPRGEEERQITRENEPWMNMEEHAARCRFEHEAFSEGIRSRDHFTMITGTIIMAVSGTVLALSLDSESFRTATVFTGWFLFAMWLLCIYCTTRRTDDIAYTRLRMLERSLDMRINLYLRSETYHRPWHLFREHFWLLILWILTIFAFVLLL